MIKKLKRQIKLNIFIRIKYRLNIIYVENNSFLCKSFNIVTITFRVRKQRLSKMLIVTLNNCTKL